VLSEASAGNNSPLAAVLTRDGVLRVPSLTKEAISLKTLHPELTLATVRCTTCGRTFVTRSTRDEIVVDVCSNCHPAYTGTERRLQNGSRIERFERRRAAARR
jgi:large subunit ribosomal protein L31